MGFIDVPNIPAGMVEVAVVDGRISREIENTLTGLGIKLIKTKKHPGVYDAISFHPDIMLHHIGGRTIVTAPGTDPCLIWELTELGFYISCGTSILAKGYPFNIAYNVARVGKFAFHNTKYTDPVVKKELNKAGMEMVHVNQGYTKCAVSVVNENSIITSDRGIAKAAESKGVEALLLEPEVNISLPGLDYGFIGGSSGMISSNRWAITGNIDNLRQADKIRSFLHGKNIQIVMLSKGKIIDIGSIIPIFQNIKI
ncbi:MAG: DUF6873 family GME fold protein [Acetivibrionales bacterium]|jgi:hypothetical protein